MTRQATVYFVIVWVASAVLWTAAARLTGGNDATVSAVVYDACRQWPMLPFALGAVAGHWLWPVR